MHGEASFVGAVAVMAMLSGCADDASLVRIQSVHLKKMEGAMVRALQLRVGTMCRSAREKQRCK